MSERKPFLLRVDPKVLEALQRWARDDLRSLNAEIEFLLRRALEEAGRLPGARRARAARPPAGEPPAREPPARERPDRGSQVR